MKLATWNVNSIKVRIDHVLKVLAHSDIDALVIQETKSTDDQFPVATFHAAGFDVYFVGQKTYNGVALVIKRGAFQEVNAVTYNIPGFPDDQKRVISATLTTHSGKAFDFVGAYFPNGQEVGSEKYLYKLEWIASLTLWLQEKLRAQHSVILGGDFNIAPTDDDVWDPREWHDCILVSRPEREAFERLLACGFSDSFTLGETPKHDFTWWDYRGSGFEKNIGLRIDHLLISQDLVSLFQSSQVLREPRGWDKPSDHAPVVLELSL